MKNNKSFFRCGDDIYEILTLNGDYGVNTKIKKRSRQSVAERYGKKFLSEIPYYDDFVNEPDILDYQRIIEDPRNPDIKMVNLFPEPPLKPDFERGCEVGTGVKKLARTWIKLVKHVFGEHYTLGLEYLSWLVQRPKQTLPVLVLTSEENHTGKTTFLNALRILLGQAMTFATYDDLMSTFNSYVKSLVIGLEEVSRSKGAMDKIKNISTAKHMSLNEKHMPVVEVDVYSKVVICSNNIRDCIKVNDNDIRYWVRRLKPIENYDQDFEEKLTREAQDFINFLGCVDLREPKSRMVFAPEEIRTEAFNELCRNSRSECAQDLEILISELLERHGTFTASLRDLRTNLGYRYTSRSISNALTRELGYTSLGNVRYENLHGTHDRGIAFRFEKQQNNP